MSERGKQTITKRAMRIMKVVKMKKLQKYTNLFFIRCLTLLFVFAKELYNTLGETSVKDIFGLKIFKPVLFSMFSIVLY